METFLALHEIASQRGDGLKPELVRLLEQTLAIEDGQLITGQNPGSAEDVGKAVVKALRNS